MLEKDMPEEEKYARNEEEKKSEQKVDKKILYELVQVEFISKLIDEYENVLIMSRNDTLIGDKGGLAQIKSKLSKIESHYKFNTKILPKISSFIQNSTMEKLYEIVVGEMGLNQHIERVPIFTQFEKYEEPASKVDQKAFLKRRSTKSNSFFSKRTVSQSSFKSTRSNNSVGESSADLSLMRLSDYTMSPVLTYETFAKYLTDFTGKNYTEECEEAEDPEFIVSKHFCFKINSKEDPSLIQSLSQFKMPEINSLSITNCGDLLDDVRHLLNTSLPDSIESLNLYCNSLGGMSADGEGSCSSSEDSKSVDRFKRSDPECDFIEDLCETINIKVVIKIQISWMNLSCKKFCALITAADNVEIICINNNNVEQSGVFELPYNTFPFLHNLDLSNNALCASHCGNLIKFLYQNLVLLKQLNSINLSGNLSSSRMKKLQYPDKIKTRVEEVNPYLRIE